MPYASTAIGRQTESYPLHPFICLINKIIMHNMQCYLNFFFYFCFVWPNVPECIYGYGWTCMASWMKLIWVYMIETSNWIQSTWILFDCSQWCSDQSFNWFWLNSIEPSYISGARSVGSAISMRAAYEMRIINNISTVSFSPGVHTNNHIYVHYLFLLLS